MEIKPVNKKVHDHLISKGYKWNARGHVDVYKKEGMIIFIYMTDYCFMLINGKVATQKEFFDETADLSI